MSLSQIDHCHSIEIMLILCYLSKHLQVTSIGLLVAWWVGRSLHQFTQSLNRNSGILERLEGYMVIGCIYVANTRSMADNDTDAFNDALKCRVGIAISPLLIVATSLGCFSRAIGRISRRRIRLRRIRAD